MRSTSGLLILGGQEQHECANDNMIFASIICRYSVLIYIYIFIFICKANTDNSTYDAVFWICISHMFFCCCGTWVSPQGVPHGITELGW